MSNFQFLKSEWPEIFQEVAEAEKLTFTSPKACAVFCRSSLEKGVRWLFDNDPDLVTPYDTKLSSLMHDPSFRNILKPSMFHEINLIRKTGNNAAHGKGVKQEDALATVKYLFRFLSYLALYYSETEPNIKPFDESNIPSGKQQEETLRSLKKLEEALDAKNEKARQDRIELEKKAEEIEALRRQLEEQQNTVKERKEEREKAIVEEEVIPLLVSEQETRKRYIDQSLKEAGWNNLREGYELEFEVTGMPLSTNPSGKGYADYVLWGDDGIPLAVIEAKRTMVDVRKGRHQATLYADCLESKYGQRPLIYYTNGFQTYLWDDTFYPERQVHGYLTKDEFQLAIDRRKTRKDLRLFRPNLSIAGRKYQLEAIKRVSEAFVTTDNDGKLTGKSRKSLLVMATGSGKTRTSAAIVDMLTKCEWAKRVLFLADRNALVTQAKNAFNNYLPNLSSIDLTKEKEDSGTRIVFSTYPTIMNKIDSAKTDDNRFYGVGHFDLIIIDEAHRSVYQKYGAIFEYFDSLLVGLTATPKTEVDRNTYELFEIEDNNPTFAYELDQAVTDEFLVPPKAFPVGTKFLHEGIKYHELSEAEKEEFEEKFGDPTLEETPELIGNDALNAWLFNTDTVDTVLHHLMENGIKVQGGDKVGKSIIFAKNHKHAVFIEERFNKNYPEYKGKFLRVIDNQETKAQDLLEKFVDETKEVDPQIAVSVDMMDTGVDAPRVVNLIFFKQVKSATKFWQMVGRGTRLCLNLFGPGEDKEHFLIFDFCGNLEYFEENPEGAEGKAVKSLSQRIFEMKLDLLVTIRENDNSTDADLQLAKDYAEELHRTVSNFDHSRFTVRMALEHVVKFSDGKMWENLSGSDMLELKKHVSKLVLPAENDHELARRFDVMLLGLKLAMLDGRETSSYINRLGRVAKALSKKSNIPAVGAKMKTIGELQTEDFWNSVSLKRLDEVRKDLRDLIKFLDTENRIDVYTNFKDQAKVDGVEEVPLLEWSKKLQSYRDRVESFIRKNKHHVTINKLRSNEPITSDELDALEQMLFDGEERGTKEDFIKEYGEQPLGRFIRTIVGMDIKAANDAFAEFISSGTLTADQITFIDNIVSFLQQDGYIDKRMLFEPPFTYADQDGLTGVFDDAEATKIISIIDEIDRNSQAS